MRGCDGAASALLLLALAAGSGCASEVIPTYGDPAQVAGGVGGAGGSVTTGNDGGGGGTTTSTPTECQVDPACAVSFLEDVLPVLDTKGGCAAASPCHQAGAKGLTLMPADAAGYYAALTSYTLDDPADPYVVPCDPDKSTLLCNLQLSGGAENPFGTCGTKMPISPDDGPTPAELDAIKDWIACGAPNN